MTDRVGVPELLVAAIALVGRVVEHSNAEARAARRPESCLER